MIANGCFFLFTRRMRSSAIFLFFPLFFFFLFFRKHFRQRSRFQEFSSFRRAAFDALTRSQLWNRATYFRPLPRQVVDITWWWPRSGGHTAAVLQLCISVCNK